MVPCVVTLAFAAIHCIIWNVSNSFASNANQIIWQICGGSLFAIPIFLTIMMWCMVRQRNDLSPAVILVIWLLVGVGVASRGLLFMVCFYSFARQPSNLYVQFNWAQFFPFLG